MAPVPPNTQRMPRCVSALALAAAGVILAGGNASAQMASELRGPVLESSVTTDLLGQFPRPVEATSPMGRPSPLSDETDGTASGRYTPSSAGALADEAPAPLDPFEEQPAAGVFTDDVLAGRSRPQTAADRSARQRTGVASERQPALSAATAAEEELTTGTVRTAPVDGFEEDRNARAGADGARAGAMEGLTRTPEENPYAPLGIRAGSFLLTPTLEQGIGWTSNAGLSPEARQSTFSETGLRLNAISDWSRHSAAFQTDMVYRKSLSGEEISEVEGGVNGELRLDLGDQWSAFAAAGYRVRPESASSPNAIEGSVSRPVRHTFTGSAGLSRDIGRLRLGLAGDVGRDIYGDATVSGGGTLPQGDRDATMATVRLRAGYEISPALRPFAEAEIGRRFYDEKLDRDGYERSADRYALRAGVELDMSDKLRGELAAGWVSERPDDDRLDTISGLSLAANLAWSPVRGTTVELSGSTEVEGSTLAGKSGSLLHSGSVAVSRELRANLTGRVLAGLGWREYFGHDETDLILRGEASLTWWMNRYAGVTGRVRHETQRGTLPDRDYDATGIYLGMTLQR